MSHVARPRTEGIVQPGERQDAKNRADCFVEELLQRAPKPAETSLRSGSTGSGGGQHRSVA